MKKLKPLQEFNDEQATNYQNHYSESKPNGLACPLCGEELLDSRPGITLMSYPPQKDVKCSNCSYIGYRIA